MLLLKDWEKLCKALSDENRLSSSISDIITNGDSKFVALKHDVETNCLNALSKARIESKYGHKATYYVQVYLLEKSDNVRILNEIQGLGHEVSYHHDVMDANKGNIVRAIENFENDLDVFRSNGFNVKTVCQHGNPIVKRDGYTSNRDFFRDSQVRERFPFITEVMVNLRNRVQVNYHYYSDAGYGWKFIFDPEENDRVDTSDKDEVIGDINNLISRIMQEESVIVSSHPHRWQKSKLIFLSKQWVFRILKRIAIISMKVPVLKRVIEKNYSLAKKF